MISDSTIQTSNSGPDPNADQNIFIKIGDSILTVLTKILPFFQGATQHLSWEESNAAALKTVQVYKDYIYSQYKADQINYGFTDLYRQYTANWIEACVNGARWSDHKDTDNYRYVAALRGLPYVNVVPTNWASLQGTSKGFETVMWLHCMWILENMDKNNPAEYTQTLTYDLRFKTLDPALVKFGLKQASGESTVPSPPAVLPGPISTISPDTNASGPVPTVLSGNIGVILGIGLLGALLYSWGKK